jgi:hypothetical protein
MLFGSQLLIFFRFFVNALSTATFLDAEGSPVYEMQ